MGKVRRGRGKGKGEREKRETEEGGEEILIRGLWGEFDVPPDVARTGDMNEPTYRRELLRFVCKVQLPLHDYHGKSLTPRTRYQLGIRTLA